MARIASGSEEKREEELFKQVTFALNPLDFRLLAVR